ncbi:AI-2E family transporter [Paracoccus sp. M683]|uniref:AI-2E family transporter n=1 Tax=Paracoccus sp. M683 TaxID=2594268 RepID=UPI0011806A63|nr:AI-2E family transporter [Paracoccus sp. M683]TRW97399.1 AI-2E family transporter [Paracoccus sp. M683]
MNQPTPQPASSQDGTAKTPETADAAVEAALPQARKTIPGWAVIGTFLIVLFWFVAYAQAFLMPVSLAILLFFVFIPIRRFLEKRGIGATISATLITAGMIVVVVVLGYLASGPVSQIMADVPNISDRLQERAQEIRSQFRKLEEVAEQIDEATNVDSAEEGAGDRPATGLPRTDGVVASPIEDAQQRIINEPGATATVTTTTTTDAAGEAEQAQEITVQVNNSDRPSTMGRALALGPAAFGQVIFTLVLLFFMISSGDLLYLKIVQSFDKLSEKRRAYEALRAIEASLSTYLGAITIINAGLGLCVGIAMWIWGMPSPLLFGLAAFVLNFIPYIGAIGGTVIAAVVALFVFDDLLTPVLVAATYLGLTSIEGQLITPYFVSRRLQLNTVVVFLTVAMWAWLWSVIGMIVAVPMLVVLRVLAEHIPGLEKFGNFLAGDIPAEMQDTDEQEARSLARSRGSMSDDEIRAASGRAPRA